MISAAEQGGLGLPDRDYYFKDDEKSVEIRKQYLAHVQKMFELLGDPAEKAAAEAKVVMDVETALAKGSLDRTSQREPEKIYHKMSTKELAELNPSFGWTQYLEGIGAPPVQSLNVAEPDFFKQFDAALKSTSLDDWKTYLRWHVVHSNAAILPSAFVNENFEFYGKTLQGTKELQPTLEALRARSDQRSGGGDRTDLCCGDLRPGRQGPYPEDGECAGESAGQRHPNPVMDGRRHQEASAR